MTVNGRGVCAALVAGVFAAALTACSGTPDDAGTPTGLTTPTGTSSSGLAIVGTKTVTGGWVDLELTDRAVNALGRAGVRWRATSPARKHGADDLRLPAISGSISYHPLAGNVSTGGGGVASKGDRQVRVDDVTVDLFKKQIIGSVGDARITLATLDVTEYEAAHTQSPQADVDGVDVTFTEAAVTALNGALGTSLPRRGITAELELHLTT